jgi:hypothetical protein
MRTSHSTVDKISGVSRYLGTCFAIMAYVRVDDAEFVQGLQAAGHSYPLALILEMDIPVQNDIY